MAFTKVKDINFNRMQAVTAKELQWTLVGDHLMDTFGKKRSM